MELGTQLADALLSAHRDRTWGAVCADDVTLHVRLERVLGVEGVPDLLADLGRPGLVGDLAVDLPRLRGFGVPQARIADAACAGVQRALVRLIQGRRGAEFLAGGPPPPTALELPVPMVRLFSQALAEARSPEQVEVDYKPALDAVLRVELERARQLPLDLIAHRTLVQAASERTLADLLRVAGRGDLNRTRHAWRAFDLLYHLGLVRLDLMEPLEAVERDTEPIRVVSETTDAIAQVDEDEVRTDELPQVELEEPVAISPLPRPALEDLATGDWTGSGERVEVPLTVHELRRLAFEFTWSNPLDVVGLPPWEEVCEGTVQAAYDRRLEQFRPARFFPDPEAMEAGATCRRLVRASRAMLEDSASLRRWEEDRRVV